MARQNRYTKKVAYSSYYSAEEARKRKAVNCVFIFLALCSVTLLIFMLMRFNAVSSEHEEKVVSLNENKELAESLYSKKKSDESRLESITGELDMLRLEYEALED